MTTILGPLLLLAPLLYAGVWAWLRGGRRQFPTAPNPARADGYSDPPDSFSAPTDFIILSAALWSACADLQARCAALWSACADLRAGCAAVRPECAVVWAECAVVSPEFRAAQGLLFSVVLAARNEAAALPHLLAALAAQALPPHCFEVLVADDHSTDGTAALVEAAARQAGFALRLIGLPPGATGKKAALAAAVAQARAPWVVCTDADCRPGPGWLRAYAGLLHAQPALHFVSGPVRLTPGGAWFDGLLGLEFAGLVGVGAACIARGRPTMCNGANLAFRRSTFHEVGGYADNQGIASGDDEFLLHKMHQRYPAGIRFLAEARAVVDTPAPATLPALLRQRVRWASKYPHYRTAAPRQLALLVLGANLSLFVGPLLALAWPGLWPWVGAGWAIKLGADVWFLLPTLRLLARRRWLAWLLPLQLLYAPYALAVGLAGQQRGGYQWKGRKVT